MSSDLISPEMLPESLESQDKTLLCTRCSAAFSIPRRPDPPAFISQFRHNYSVDYLEPSEDERRALLELHTEAKANVARCDEEISRLKSITTQLERQRAELEVRQDRYQEIWTYVDEKRHLQLHVRRLPTELLLKIFLYCVQSRHGYDRRDKLASPITLAPLNLELVCLRWRDIVSSSKELWSFISMDFSDESHVPTTEVLGTFLRRSGDYPLTLDVRDQCGSQGAIDVLGILALHSHRWRDVVVALALYGDTSSRLGRVWQGIKGALPVLENLAISGGRNGQVADLFETAPRLQKLTLTSSFWPGRNFRISDLPWGQITDLHLACFPNVPLLSILACCHQLSRLTLQDVDQLSLSESDGARISSNLRSLFIKESPSGLRTDRVPYATLNNLSWLLDGLELPQLVSLSVTAHDRSKWPQSQLTSLLRHSCCHLETLSLTGDIWIKPLEFLELISLLPTLTSLRVHDLRITHQILGHDASPVPIITDETLSSLVYSSLSESTVLLPSLTELELLVAPSFHHESLLSMIESRWFPIGMDAVPGSQGVACLKHVSLLPFKRTLTAGILSRIGKLRQAGLRVNIS